MLFLNNLTILQTMTEVIFTGDGQQIVLMFVSTLSAKLS